MNLRAWIHMVVGLGLLLSPWAGGLLLSQPIQAAPEATRWYVKPGEAGECTAWTDACELQVALSKAGAGDQIWVAEGTYKPTAGGDRDATFQLRSGVEVYGGFAGTESSLDQRNPDPATNNTVLSGDIGTGADSSDNSYHVVTGSGVTETAVLDGFTVSGGFADGPDPYDRGGGMYNNAGSPTLANLTFADNVAAGMESYGGGMYNNNSSPALTNVTFSGNVAYDGGGMYNDGSSPALTNVTFSGNGSASGAGMSNYDNSSPTLMDVSFSGNSASYDGGGMYNGSNSSPTLTDVTFSGNTAGYYGGGMHNGNNSNPTLTGVTFSNNRADYYDGGGMRNSGSSPTLTDVTFSGNTAANGGGICNNDSSPALVNVTFSGNTAQNGGGMYNSWSSPALVNVTFSGNTANSQGGGMYNSNDSSPALRNTIVWGNTAGGGSPQIHDEGASSPEGPCMVQGGYSGCDVEDAASPFVDADGADNVPGTADDDLRLVGTSNAIDAGNKDHLPEDVDDLDGDGDTTEKLPYDLVGDPRCYADMNLDDEVDGEPDPCASNEVDLGAFEAGCPGWQVHRGYELLAEGQKYRLGFHSDLVEVDPPDTISGTLESYADERAAGHLADARAAYELALNCAPTVTETHQALLGLQKVLWEQATGALLQGNEEMVQALDLVDDDPGGLGGEILQLTAAIGYFDEATVGYLEPLTGAYGDQFLAMLQLTRTHPLSDTQGYVDLERLSLAVARKSRANLELGERQFRDGQRDQAESTLRQGYNTALAELTLLYTLWPEVVENPNYGAVLRNMTDMTRIYGYLVGDENPFGYDAAFVPFHFDYRYLPQNNYEQTYDLADEDIGDAEFAVAAAQGKQEEIDDDYETMQTRLEAAEARYDERLVALCGAGGGGEPDLEHCSGGTIQEQRLAVEGAMLRVEAVVGQMEMQVELVRIEQDRAATVAGIHRATAQMIMETGEELADLAAEEAKLRFARSDTQGFLGIIRTYFGFSIGPAGPSGSPSNSGWMGALFEWGAWEAEKAKVEELAKVSAAKERLYALQKARPHYAEAEIVQADSLALIRKYFLELGQLGIDYAIARNDLMQELARLTSLQGQVQYLWTEKAKAQAFTVLLFQDPAGRVLREHYVEIANDAYERALETTFQAGRALEYEINQDVAVDGVVLHDLDDLYALQDTVDLRLALDDVDDAYDDWKAGIGAPQVYPDEILYLSQAVGFMDSYDPSLGRIVSREEKFNAFIRDPGNRVDLDGNGSAESLKFTFQTSILGGNPAFETGVFNDRVIAVNMRVRGADLGVTELRARLTQGGTSIVRTRDAFQKCDPKGRYIDDLRTYRLQPKTATIRAFANDTPFPAGATSYELATRSVASTNWTLLISKCSSEADCGPYWVPGNLPLKLDNIDEIELILDHEAYTIEPGSCSATVFEPLPGRPYRPMEHVLPPLSLSRPPLVTQGRIHTEQSAATDLNDTYVGAVVITQPLWVDPIGLVVVLTDTQGTLSGYISPTLSYPAQGDGWGPALAGGWDGDSFGLESEVFQTELSAGIVITRQVILHSGVISDSGQILTGVYSETLAGLTPEPLEIVGEFRLERPSHALVPAFGASPAAGTAPLAVQFEDLSLGNPTTWAWDFGDGGASSERHPAYVYTRPGTYTVTLTVTNAFDTGTVVEPERIAVRQPRIYLPLVMRSAP